MKKWAFLILLIFCLSFTGASLYKDSTSCSINNEAFQVGELLTYKVYYNWNFLWLSTGEITFEVKSGVIYEKSCYHVVSIGKTYEAYDWFFKVRDKYETFIDKTTMLPLKFIRDVNEGGYTIDENITFNNEKNIAIELKDDDKVPTTFKIPNCTQDILSAVYYSRCLDFSNYKPNEIIPITVFLDKTVYPLYVRYIGKETIKTKLGKFKCIKFKPLLIEGTLFEGGEEMIVWVTDDKNKIPIRVESPIIVGSIKVDLINYSGLRNKFTSKKK